MINAPATNTRSPAIDLLRALLAIWVVLTHVIPDTATAGGAIPAVLIQGMSWENHFFQPFGELHPAVVCFIVLSGYCIHRNGLRGDHADVKSYGIRRFFRIYPVYLLATAFGIACFLIDASKTPALAVALSGTPSITANCVAVKLTLINAVDPVQLTCAYVGNAPLATVMVEMCLYITYPLLLLFVVKRFGEWPLWTGLVALTVLGTAVVLLHPELGNWWQNASVFSFLLYWWIGAKFIDPRFAKLALRYWPWLLLAWLTLSLTPLAHVGLVTGELRKLLMGVLFGVLVVVVDARRYALPAAVQVVGQAGYSIYAFHAPLVYLLLIFGTPWYVVLLSAVALGILGHRLVERPGIVIGKKLAYRITRPSPAPIRSTGTDPSLGPVRMPDGEDVGSGRVGG